MTPPESAPHIDLSLWTSGELIAMLKEGNRQLALDELFKRHWPETIGLITTLAAKVGLQAADREDAVQEAYGWLRKAQEDYDTRQLGRKRPRGFHSFMWRRLTDRFANFVRVGRRRSLPCAMVAV